jgi:heme exporter protein A
MTAAVDQPPAAQVAAEAVRVIGLSKAIDERPILRDITFGIPTGQSIALLGANGAGKSTLLKILATLIPASAGEIQLFGELLSRANPRLRARIGLIGHQSMLYRDLSARENLEFFGKLYGVDRVGERAASLLELVGLADRADDFIKTFSRGMTQRVAIARALMHRPQLILADEPFAGLDVPSVKSVASLLRVLHEGGRTIVLVDHDIARSLQLTDRVLVLRRGQVAIDAASNQVTAEQVERELSEP